MKKFFVSFAAFVAATSATAGNLVYTAPEVVTLEEPARMGGSGSWLIPLIIIAVLILSLKGEEEIVVTPIPNAQL